MTELNSGLESFPLPTTSFTSSFDPYYIEPVVPPKPQKTNYHAFVIFMLAILFIMSSMSYVNLSRKINADAISDPVIQDEINTSRWYSFWIMILLGVTFIVYGYILVYKL